MTIETIAYLAGAMDADGCFSIKKTTQRKRNRGDCASTLYVPRVSIGQVQPTVPWLMRSTFGGLVYVSKPGTANSRPLHIYHASSKQAGDICRALLPHLRIKQERAQIVIDLHDWRTNHAVRRPTHWWASENPDWQSGPLITSDQVMQMLGYTGYRQVTQAIENGLLLALPLVRVGRGKMPRFPLGLLEYLVSLQGKGKHRRYILPPQYVARCEELYQSIRQMNCLGVHGTCVTHRTGHHAPAE